MNEMREKRVFYYCDAKWSPGNKCKNPKPYLLEEVLMEEDREEVVEDVREEGGTKVVELANDIENQEISLHALTGFQNSKTMRLKGN